MSNYKELTSKIVKYMFFWPIFDPISVLFLDRTYRGIVSLPLSYLSTFLTCQSRPINRVNSDYLGLRYVIHVLKQTIICRCDAPCRSLRQNTYSTPGLQCIYPRTFASSLPLFLPDPHLFLKHGFRHYWNDSAADTTPRVLVPRRIHYSLCPTHLVPCTPDSPL